MKNKDSKELIDELMKLNTHLSEVVSERIIPLDESQKNWKPSQDKWSILECFAHMNKIYSFYIPTIKLKIEKKANLDPKEKFTSSHIGRTLYRSMQLNKANRPRRRLKSPRSFNPKVSPDLITGKDDRDFLSYQKQMEQLLKDTFQVNLRKIKIPLSLSKVVKIRLGDALLFVVYHNERHVQQALNIIEHPKFPKS